MFGIWWILSFYWIYPSIGILTDFNAFQALRLLTYDFGCSLQKLNTCQGKTTNNSIPDVHAKRKTFNKFSSQCIKNRKKESKWQFRLSSMPSVHVLFVFCAFHSLSIFEVVHERLHSGRRSTETGNRVYHIKKIKKRCTHKGKCTFAPRIKCSNYHLPLCK